VAIDHAAADPSADAEKLLTGLPSTFKE